MLERLDSKGIFLTAYNRYVDDMTAINDVKDENDEGKLFLMLKKQLNKVDPLEIVPFSWISVLSTKSSKSPPSQSSITRCITWLSSSWNVS